MSRLQNVGAYCQGTEPWAESARRIRPRQAPS